MRLDSLNDAIELTSRPQEWGRGVACGRDDDVKFGWNTAWHQFSFRTHM
jgi:hypothetical protein